MQFTLNSKCRFGAYIVAVAENQFMCHVFFCAPHAGTLTKAIQEACKVSSFWSIYTYSLFIKNYSFEF